MIVSLKTCIPFWSGVLNVVAFFPCSIVFFEVVNKIYTVCLRAGFKKGTNEMRDLIPACEEHII